MQSTWAWRRASFLAGLAVPFLLSVTVHASSEHDDDNLREDVFSCEEALGKLETCCDTTFALSCRYYYDHQSSCESDSSSTTSYKPDLDLNESRCVRDRSCAQIVSGGLCDRAARVLPGRNDSSSSSGDSYGSGYAAPTKSPASPEARGPVVCP